MVRERSGEIKIAESKYRGLHPSLRTPLVQVLFRQRRQDADRIEKWFWPPNENNTFIAKDLTHFSVPRKPVGVSV
jgi:hypothetical protein